MRRAISLLAPFLLVWPAAVALSQEASIRESRAAASGALATFRQLAGAQKNYRAMGFESLKEMEEIAIGEPFRVFMVRLDELAKYGRDQNPNELLHGRKQLVYPVLIGEQVRSSITVASTGKGWEATSFGSPHKAKLLSKTRASSSEATRLAAAAYFEVEVPGLRLVFVGHESDGALMLTPVLDDKGFGLKAGVTVRAEDVFATIAPAARSQPDFPG